MSGEGKLFIISAPSGAGKTTLEQMLLDSELDLIKSVSATTRKPRASEANNRDYIFLSKDEFAKERDEGKFLEWAEVFGNFYATPKTKVINAIEEGKNIILSIDVQGAEQVKKIFPEAILIFIKTPNFNTLKSRLEKRLTDSNEEIDRRLEVAKDELAKLDMYNYTIVNDDLDNAFYELKNVIKKCLEKEKEW
ncbi:MAG: guanylate kinase [Candidatus Kappaea frigidicola]|nr:guanylate kinase [Candidatus Kappaea frigidicola]